MHGRQQLVGRDRTNKIDKLDFVNIDRREAGRTATTGEDGREGEIKHISDSLST